MSADTDKIREKFWKALKDDRTVMLGLCGADNDHARPMTAQTDDQDPEGAIWFFTAKDTVLVTAMEGNDPAIVNFASKGHDIFACIHGTLSISNDPEMIDRLWNRFVAAWYEDGKEDPKLTLLKFQPRQAEIWTDASSLVAGVKMLLGIDPKDDYKDKVAKVNLSAH